MTHTPPLPRWHSLLLAVSIVLLTASAVHAQVVEELWCQNAEHRIYGRLYRPAPSDSPSPLVIIAHGFGGNHQFGHPYAQTFAQQGYLCYCFDFCGGGNHSRSDGATTEMSIFTESADLRAVLRQLRSLPEVDTLRITLMGESQGGIVTAITAAQVQPLIHDIILFYPAFCIPDDSRRRYPTLADVPDVADIWGVKLGRVYAERFYDYDVFREIAPYSKPALILHGDADRTVPVSYSDQAASLLPDVEYRVLHGVDHGFPEGLPRELATDLCLQFLKRQGKPCQKCQ